MFHNFWTPTKHQTSQKKLLKVSHRDLLFFFHFQRVTLGSQSAPQDLHFEPSGTDLGPRIHIISLKAFRCLLAAWLFPAVSQEESEVSPVLLMVALPCLWLEAGDSDSQAYA